MKENRKKLTEIYLQLETTINIKPNIIESTPTFVLFFLFDWIKKIMGFFFRTSAIESSTPINLPQDNEEDKVSTTENISQVFNLA